MAKKKRTVAAIKRRYYQAPQCQQQKLASLLSRSHGNDRFTCFSANFRSPPLPSTTRIGAIFYPHTKQNPPPPVILRVERTDRGKKTTSENNCKFFFCFHARRNRPEIRCGLMVTPHLLSVVCTVALPTHLVSVRNGLKQLAWQRHGRQMSADCTHTPAL